MGENIANISLTDNAVYKCTASNTAGKDEILYTVDVVKAPLIETGGTLQVVEGEVADLECTAAGEPVPEITWQRNGIRVETGDRYVVDGRKLRISQSRNTDAGIYVCVATNEAGTAQQAYTLEVLVPPKIHVVSPDESVVPVGGPFSLKCGARGYPDPAITWSVEGETIVSGRDGYSVAEDGTLFVIKASNKNLMNMKCVAKNDAGRDEKEYVVKTISPPTISKEGIKTINTTEGEATLMVCEVEGEVPDVVWHKVGG
uniref:Ig-like domain-containing protein n=1 Tax=Plectus sambesii TaxID=2011161 RepID=A0A914V1J2_9BILA